MSCPLVSPYPPCSCPLERSRGKTSLPCIPPSIPSFLSSFLSRNNFWYILLQKQIPFSCFCFSCLHYLRNYLIHVLLFSGHGDSIYALFSLSLALTVSFLNSVFAYSRFRFLVTEIFKDFIHLTD